MTVTFYYCDASGDACSNSERKVAATTVAKCSLNLMRCCIPAEATAAVAANAAAKEANKAYEFMGAVGAMLHLLQHLLLLLHQQQLQPKPLPGLLLVAWMAHTITTDGFGG